MPTVAYFGEFAGVDVVASESRCSVNEASVISMPHPLTGVWLSEGGSMYLSNGLEFVCLSVHDREFSGWVGRIAISDIERTESGWVAQQAIRQKQSGHLSHWLRLSLTLEGDIVTKYFSADVPGHLLPYGHLERYRRLLL